MDGWTDGLVTAITSVAACCYVGFKWGTRQALLLPPFLASVHKEHGSYGILFRGMT